jgi:methyltransferase (TIGR00027 family)
MQSRKASKTAAFTAVLRAAHQLVDAEPRIMDDPIAVGLVEEATPERIAARREALLAPGLMIPRAAVLLRSRYAEDLLAEAAARGVGQFVVLGAGLETFAFRQPGFARRMRIYEVDHPATQFWKRQRLATAGLTQPENLRWVPIDFEQQTLAAGLAAAGFDPARPAFFSWLGVTQYLTFSAIGVTLEVVARLPSPTTIVLTVMLPDVDLPPEEAAAARTVADDAAAAGEPWLTRIRPAEMVARLRGLGFRDVVHLTPHQANSRYFVGRRDALRAPHAVQLLSATT